MTNKPLKKIPKKIFKKITLTTYCAGLISFYCLTGYAATPAETDRGASELQSAVPDVHEKILQVPTDNSPPVLLQVTVYTPDGTGPFPLVVINHGNADEPPKDQPRSRLSYASLYFLSRGYAVVQPMMRGYAGSGGKQSQNGCDLVAGNMNNAFDIKRVIQYMSDQPYIDGSRVIVAGQSFGGYNTLAVGALNLPAIKGIINFNGGMGIKECSEAVDRMVDTAGYFGAHTQIPSVWFYGSNDILIPESTWRAAYRRYNLMGGKATLVSIGNFKDNSHNFLGHVEGVSIIAPPLDAFLHQLGLPNTVKYPDFVPPSNPTSSHFANINDVNAVPISPEARVQYQKFLTMPSPRVFMIKENGGITISSGGVNPLVPALNSCKQQHQQCWPYAIDQTVVWDKTRFTPIPPPSHYADINDVNAVPISAEAHAEYQKFLNSPLPRVFFIAKDFVTMVSGGLDPLGRGLKFCEQQHLQCWPYAIDNQVVWVKPILTPIPPASHFADINAVPVIGPQAREAYQAFLKMPLPRVFALTDDRETYEASGGLDPLGHVLDSCQKNAKICAPYAVDNQVVWSPSAAFLHPTHFADIRDLDAIPYINLIGRKTYQKFLTAHSPRAFVIAPDGASFLATSGSQPLQTAMEQCASTHRGCAAYALDNDVVWVSHR